jgi:hypothetical protein
MTKKEFVSFLIVALGVWSACKMLMSIPSVLVLLAGYLSNDPGLRIEYTLSFPMLPVLAWALVALLLIRKATRWSELVLRWAGIKGDEQVANIAVGDVLPAAVSLIGLYFVISYLPGAIVTLIRWFAVEAQGAGGAGASGQGGNLHAADAAELALIVVFALFVFFRGRFIAGLAHGVQKE